MNEANLKPYRDQLDVFLGGRLPAEEFSRWFFSHYKKDKTDWTEPEYQALESLFTALEDFVPDPALFDASNGDIDEKELRRRCQDVRGRLG